MAYGPVFSIRRMLGALSWIGLGLGCASWAARAHVLYGSQSAPFEFVLVIAGGGFVCAGAGSLFGRLWDGAILGVWVALVVYLAVIATSWYMLW